MGKSLTQTKIIRVNFIILLGQLGKRYYHFTEAIKEVGCKHESAVWGNMLTKKESRGKGGSKIDSR